MIKITLIGAGSTVFAKRLVGDILLTPELGSGVEIMLHDIDTERLKTSEIVTRRVLVWRFRFRLRQTVRRC